METKTAGSGRLRRSTPAVLAAAAMALISGASAFPATGTARAEASPAVTTRVGLGRTTIISGSQSAMARVSLPRAAALDLSFSPRRRSGPTPAVDIVGGGRFAGIVLVDDKLPERSNEFVLAGRWLACQSTCRRGAIENVFHTPDLRRKGSMTLPPGNYRLYLIADDTHVQVTLRLGGLSGHVRIAPTETARVDVRTPEVRLDVEPGGTHVFSAGSTYEGSGLGFGLAIWVLRDEDPGPLEVNECLYTYDPPPEDVAYGPHCSRLADAGATTTFTPVRPRRSRHFALVNLWTIPDGRHQLREISTTRGYGLWFRSTGEIESLVNHALMFSFE